MKVLIAGGRRVHRQHSALACLDAGISPVILDSPDDRQARGSPRAAPIMTAGPRRIASRPGGQQDERGRGHGEQGPA